MSHTRYTLALFAALALGGAWYASRPGSPNLNAAQAAKRDEKKAQEAPTPPSNRAFELAGMLEKTVDFQGVDAQETKLGEELERMQKIYKLTFDVNERAFEADWGEDHSGILDTLFARPTPVPPMKATLKTVLRRILSRVPAKSGATYLIRKDRIEITTERAARRELGIAPAKGEERLLPLISKEFSRKHIKSYFDEIADVSGFNVVLDIRGESQAGRDVSLRLLNVPADTAVRLVADMAGLEVARLDNVFYVTTPENAARLRKERAKAEPCCGIRLWGLGR